MTRPRTRAWLVVGLPLALSAWPGPVEAQADPAELRRALRRELGELQARLGADEGTATAPAAARPAHVQSPPHGGPRTVTVRCALGQSIRRALEKQGSPLVVEVRGSCHEDVVIARDDVVLRGADPASDGVRGVGPGTSSLDGVIEVRGARDVAIENLTVTGGDHSGIAVDKSDNVTIRNCRVRDNGTRGLVASYSTGVFVFDTTFRNNGLAELRPFDSRPVWCTGCTIDASQNGVLAAGSDVSLTATSVTAPSLALAVFDGVAFVTGSALRDSTQTGGFSVVAVDYGVINFLGSELQGGLAVDNASMFLDGTRQTANERGINGVFDASVRLFDGSSLLATGPLGTLVEEFGRLTLYDDTVTVTGNLECFAGGDAFCADPAQVSGTSSCGQCPKP
jgi:parallel beta-helix repeat protein